MATRIESMEQAKETLGWVFQGADANQAVFDRAEKKAGGPEVQLSPGDLQMIITVQMVQISALRDIIEFLLDQ